MTPEFREYGTIPAEQYDTAIKASLTRHYGLARRAALLSATSSNYPESLQTRLERDFRIPVSFS